MLSAVSDLRQSTRSVASVISQPKTNQPTHFLLSLFGVRSHPRRVRFIDTYKMISTEVSERTLAMSLTIAAIPMMVYYALCLVAGKAQMKSWPARLEAKKDGHDMRINALTKALFDVQPLNMQPLHQGYAFSFSQQNSQDMISFCHGEKIDISVDHHRPWRIHDNIEKPLAFRMESKL